MNQQRGLILAGIIGLVIIFVVGLVSLSHKNNYDPTAPREPETASNQAEVVITGTGDLANILLSQQFFAAKANLAAHLKKAYPQATAAEISRTVVNNDGSVSFEIKISSYNKTLAVTIHRLIQGNISLQIPDDHYDSGTIQVYSSNSSEN